MARICLGMYVAAYSTQRILSLQIGNPNVHEHTRTAHERYSVEYPTGQNQPIIVSDFLESRCPLTVLIQIIKQSPSEVSLNHRHCVGRRPARFVVEEPHTEGAKSSRQAGPRAPDLDRGRAVHLPLPKHQLTCTPAVQNLYSSSPSPGPRFPTRPSTYSSNFTLSL